MICYILWLDSTSPLGYNIIGNISDQAPVHLISSRGQNTKFVAPLKFLLGSLIYLIGRWKMIVSINISWCVMPAQKGLAYAKNACKMAIMSQLWQSLAPFWSYVQPWKGSPCLTTLPKYFLTRFQPPQPTGQASTASNPPSKNTREKPFLLILVMT